jgi:hypothetical protein
MPRIGAVGLGRLLMTYCTSQALKSQLSLMREIDSDNQVPKRLMPYHEQSIFAPIGPSSNTLTWPILYPP